MSCFLGPQKTLSKKIVLVTQERLILFPCAMFCYWALADVRRGMENASVWQWYQLAGRPAQR